MNISKIMFIFAIDLKKVDDSFIKAQKIKSKIST